MSEYQLTFAGESDAAIADILHSPESVRSEYVEFGEKGREKKTGLAVYLTPENQDHYNHDVLEDRVADFLFDDLSDESYNFRFLSGKPTEKSGIPARHFVGFDDGRYHSSIAILHDDKIIGAASIFEPKVEHLREKRIVEVSITIADRYHRQGLGAQLLQRAVAQAAEDGFCYVLATFHKENDPSRGLVDKVLVPTNLVAGHDDLEERCYRIGPEDPEEDSAIQRILSGDVSPEAIKQHRRSTRSHEHGRPMMPLAGAIGKVAAKAAKHVTRPRYLKKREQAKTLKAGADDVETQLAFDIS